MSAPLLLIDAGNSRLKWASSVSTLPIQPEGELITAEATPDFVKKLADEHPNHRAVLCSVVPRLIPSFQEAFASRLLTVTAHSPELGLLFDYPKPSELGVDRLVAAAAIRYESTGPAIIVQCGTATAFSVLDEDGRFCGGVIAPGPQAQLAALVGATAQLPFISLHPSSEILGTSTEEAIRLGIMLGYVGGVNEILRRLSRLSKPPLTPLILTGGNAPLLTESLEFPFTLRPLLVFEGLRIIGLRAFKDV